MTNNEPEEVEGPEQDHINEVNVHPTGPTEADEMVVLSSLYSYDSKLGVFHTPLFEEE